MTTIYSVDYKVTGKVTGKDTGNVTKQSLSSHQVVTKLSSSIPMICDLLEKMTSRVTRGTGDKGQAGDKGQVPLSPVPLSPGTAVTQVVVTSVFESVLCQFLLGDTPGRGEKTQCFI